MRRVGAVVCLLVVLLLAACDDAQQPLESAGSRAELAGGGGTIGINILLNTDVTNAILADLGTHGTVKDVIYEIDAVILQAAKSELSAIQGLPYVKAANSDAERHGSPIDPISVTNFEGGRSSWNLDAVNITTGPGFNNRSVAFDGTGVFVAVLDTGLLDTWRQYFPQERIAVQFAKSFGGGGSPGANVSEQPNKWEQDTNSHGTHVTSVILGFGGIAGGPHDGVAPQATVIPVKVLNQSGFGFSSVVARGVVYIANLKANELAGSPVVINMSLGGPSLDAVEQAALDFAVAQGVIVVASAGNEGDAGMGFPGAYAPVISVAASGWIGEWRPGADGNPFNWWRVDDVPEKKVVDQFYITDFSSRELAGQDLDVSAPGSWVVGPFQLQNGTISFFFVGGTSQAAPHVSGIVALMAQKNGGLTAPQAESILEATAIPLPPDSRTVIPEPGAAPQVFSWGANATGAGLVTADAALAGTS